MGCDCHRTDKRNTLWIKSRTVPTASTEYVSTGDKANLQAFLNLSLRSLPAEEENSLRLGDYITEKNPL